MRVGNDAEQMEMKMKVRELVRALEQYDPEAEVHFSYNYGDHWRTMVAPKVRNVEENTVKFSDYHRLPVLDEDGEDSVIVLSS